MSENAAWAFALYDYDAVEAGDLKFKAGDLLHIVSLPSMNADFNWIVAENPRTGDQGEVPSNYITRESGYSATLDAFRDTDRSGANSLLQSQSYLSNFNYIVRPSRDNDGMALSVRTAKGFVTHYKIYFNPQDKSCRLFPSESFDTIEDLVIHYMGGSTGGQQAWDLDKEHWVKEYTHGSSWNRESGVEAFGGEKDCPCDLVNHK